MVKANALGSIDPASGKRVKKAGKKNLDFSAPHSGSVAHHHPQLSRAQWAEKRAASTVVAAGGAWHQMQDGAGRTYYWNADTGVTQWEPPRELRSLTSTATEISVQ